MDRGRTALTFVSVLMLACGSDGPPVAETEGDTEIVDKANDVIHIPDAGPHLTAILATIPLQLLAYHVATAKGTDVDQPRNLAKSVTVE